MPATLSAVVTTQLPDIAKKLLDQQVFVTVSTLNPDGSPQSSVLWATYDGDDILLSTVVGRAKERSWRRDPRVSVLFFDPATPYNYVEVRGRVELTTDGGPELIQRLSQLYVGAPYTADEGTDNVRVVARVKADKVITR
jgi:PPOX class probable F420-dependent enzyme